MTPCGCKIRCIVDDIEEIVYCPTHANAFKMKEALKTIMVKTDDLHIIGGDCETCNHCISEIAKQALSEIK